MNEPRPKVTSARPEERASSVANRSYTRIGSSELSTVTAVPRVIRSVRGGGGGQHDVRGGDRVVVPVVLAHAEGVQADPVGQHGLLDDVAEHLGVRERARRQVQR